MSLSFSVPDMSCGHCRASIETALKPLGAAVAFDQPARQIIVTGPTDPAPIIAALDAIGFEAKPA